MKKSKKTSERIVAAIRGAFRSNPRAFCNIAEGTHAGSITMTAEESVDSANLVVKAGANEGGFKIAGAGDKPFGVCTDEGAAGERLAVLLAGCAESTVMCRAAGSIAAGATVYTAANGKVSATAGDGAYKVGIALCSAASGGTVEVDPRGFGESAWQLYSCGVHTWKSATSVDKLECAELPTDAVVIASVQTAGGSEKTAKATVGETGITFTLDANGTSGTTKIAWIAIRRN